MRISLTHKHMPYTPWSFGSKSCPPQRTSLRSCTLIMELYPNNLYAEPIESINNCRAEKF